MSIFIALAVWFSFAKLPLWQSLSIIDRTEVPDMTARGILIGELTKQIDPSDALPNGLNPGSGQNSIGFYRYGSRGVGGYYGIAFADESGGASLNRDFVVSSGHRHKRFNKNTGYLMASRIADKHSSLWYFPFLKVFNIGVVNRNLAFQRRLKSLVCDFDIFCANFYGLPNVSGLAFGACREPIRYFERGFGIVSSVDGALSSKSQTIAGASLCEVQSLFSSIPLEISRIGSNNSYYDQHSGKPSYGYFGSRSWWALGLAGFIVLFAGRVAFMRYFNSRVVLAFFCMAGSVGLSLYLLWRSAVLLAG